MQRAIEILDQESPSVAPTCRFCGTAAQQTFVDLGMSPLCQSHITPDQLDHMEPFYPLHARVCPKCFLVQVGEFVAPEGIFREYAYFSSYSESWVRHAQAYVESITDRLQLGRSSMVMEIASNDGYLLQHFVAEGIKCLGIEPAENVAEAAIAKGVPTVTRFFGLKTARQIGEQFGKPDLLLGNNVLAHVPDLNDFVAGMKSLLAPNGTITMEFPHLMQLVEQNQFDTIYHEHFSYFSLFTCEQVFAAHGLTLFDLEELPTHGGSLRVYVRHAEDEERPVSRRVSALRDTESRKGYCDLSLYESFGEKVKRTKRGLLEFLINAKSEGKSVVGYGAPGKGNTLLNYCGIREDFLDYTVDRNPYKQGKFTPGTRIPILHPDMIYQSKPDYLLILPWNLRDEIMAQMAHIRDWGAQFVVPIPEVQVLP